MTVRNLTVKNYRAIESLDLPLDPKLTVLHGANGSGKTSILTALALAMAPRRHGNHRRVALDWHEGSTRRPEIVLDHGGAIVTKVAGTTGGHAGDGGWGHFDLQTGGFVLGKAQGGGIAPMCMLYDTDRRVVSSLTERYVGTQVNYDELFDWFYAKENEELRLQRKRKDFETQDRELSSVREAICSMLRGASEPHIDMGGNAPPRFSVTLADGGADRQLSLEQLSGGYQSMLSVAADIGWRLARYRRSRARRRPDRGAIVLIDEVELHLHPAWQQRVLGDLMRTFPDVQFVVSTHSPQVLTTVPPEHIVELAREGDNIVAHSTDAATYGAEAGDVLSDVMGVDERPDNRFKEKLAEYQQLVRDGDGESERGLALREELEELSPRDFALSRADLEIEQRKLFRRMASEQ